MANTTKTKKNSATSSSKNQPTVTELRDWYAKEQKRIENFERSEKALQILDATKNSSKTFSTFSKETLRTYMKNPLTNYKNLRNLSRFLYYRSQTYRRLIRYRSNFINLDYRSVIPNIDLNKGFNSSKDLKSYYETLNFVDQMPLNSEFYKMINISWREDAAFGCAYFDESDSVGNFYILPLNPDYCKITALYPDGSLGFDYDMSYFDNRKDVLEMWGEKPWGEMYKEYQSSGVKWIPMPDEHCVCLKVNLDSPEDILIPFMGMFDSLISLEDLQEITAIADEQQIYKLLAVKIPLLDSDTPDDFAVDPDTAIKYYNKFDIPDYANAVLLPGLDIEEISFDSDHTNDVTRIESATRSVVGSAGGGQILNNTDITGSTGLNLATKADELEALRPLLDQIEGIVNRLLSFQLKNPAKVKFLEVSRYTKDELSNSLLQEMNYGAPWILTLGALHGFSASDMITMANLNQSLGLEKLFKPVATASTRSAADSKGGAPTKSDGEITEDGESSRDKKDRSNG